jgi:PhnB protein
MTQLNPYLHFKDNARAAMEFYESIFGGELKLMTFGDMGAPGMDPAEASKVMHASLETSDLVIMAADTPNHMEYQPGATISMSLSGTDEQELRGYWDKLAAGAQVTVPLEKQVWGDTFGMLADKFGIEWLVNIDAGHQQ